MFELLKVEKIIIFSKKLRVRIIRASELIEDIRYVDQTDDTEILRSKLPLKFQNMRMIDISMQTGKIQKNDKKCIGSKVEV